jgi:hypothetical protein
LGHRRCLETQTALTLQAGECFNQQCRRECDSCISGRGRGRYVQLAVSGSTAHESPCTMSVTIETCDDTNFLILYVLGCLLRSLAFKEVRPASEWQVTLSEERTRQKRRARTNGARAARHRWFGARVFRCGAGCAFDSLATQLLAFSRLWQETAHLKKWHYCL